MSDRYGSFVKSPIGKKIAKNLGLPLPVKLDRYEAGQKVVRGSVLFGSASGDDSSISDAVATVLSDLQAEVYVANDDANSSSFEATKLETKDSADHSEKYKVLVFDASNIAHAPDLKELYAFFHPVARQIADSGRVVIIGRPPEECETIGKTLSQRSLEGFVKSIGKEFKKGITAQLIYVSEGEEANIASTLRFFMSARSAYVSGQVVRVNSGGKAVDVDWTKPLANKTALVTGASRGIGASIAEVLARDGAHVICLDIPQQQSDLQKVAGKIGGSTLALDVTAADAGEKIAAAAQKRGGLDVIVHNAGVTRDKTLANMDEKQWDMVIDINLQSNAMINDYLFDHDVINQDGSIVCVSSLSGIAGNVGQTNYATSKAGVIGLVSATAKKLKGEDKNITINAVAPGFIETQMTAAIPLAIREAGRRMNSMSQGGLPVDVAETIAWLATPASSSVNGQTIRVGGQSLLGA